MTKETYGHQNAGSLHERLAGSAQPNQEFHHNGGSNKIIHIGRPYLEERGDLVRIISKVVYCGEEKILWYEVQNEYREYLCTERSDGFLVSMLWLAMKDGCDVVCEAPVTEELLYQLRTYLIPSVVKYSKALKAPQIISQMATGAMGNVGAVGTGLSCGVDSLHVVACQGKGCEYPSLRLTHLTIFNVGAYKQGELRGYDQYLWQREHAREFCHEYGYNLIEVNSNLAKAFPHIHLLTNTYDNAGVVLLLQKLFKTYYIASDGLDFSKFTIKNNDVNDSAHYNLLLLDCLSTQNLRFYSEGGAKSRYDKTLLLSEFEPAWKYLHVCGDNSGPNCTTNCRKCLRTVTMLDMMHKLERFGNCFDLNKYFKERKKCWKWLFMQVGKGRDLYVSEARMELMKRISLWVKFFWLFDVISFCCKNYLRNTKCGSAIKKLIHR